MARTTRLDAWWRLTVMVAAVPVVALAVHWVRWNVDQAFYPNGTVAFYYVATGYEFLIVPWFLVPWV